MKAREDRKQPLFMISVVSRMLSVHPQTLRLYEREGLVTPHRTKRTRLYSQEDIERLSMILRLTRELGVNRAGVEIILRMRNRLETLQHEMDEMMKFLEKDLRDDFENRLRKLFFED
ncbi:MAG TPA: MerR family transcriptional regulator [Nitrospiraceae bacterium]|jgi:MerR family transcriptional regulator/heat shock protein HspR|nr:MerR family transcriptional regulator [Nitrospiraceae bacterium]